MVTIEIHDKAQPHAQPLDFIVPDGLTRDMAEDAANFLAKVREANGTLKIVGSIKRDGDKQQEPMVLPRLAVDMLVKMLTEMGRGYAVVVEPVEAELTTQQAADILNVSRPHLIGLLEKGEIPYHRVGNRRKISLMQLLAYKRRDDKYRDAIADEIMSETQNIGIDYPEWRTQEGRIR